MYDSHGNTAAVQATNDDAFASKLSCVKKGYMKDDYIPHISVRKPFRRSPFINLRLLCLLGCYLETSLYQFVDVEKKSDEDAPVKKQILSLGAGFYTTYFQLQFFPDLPSPLLFLSTLWIERMELFDEFEEWYMMQGLFGEFGFVNNNKTRLPSS